MQDNADDQDFDEDSVVSVSFASIGPDEKLLEQRQELLQEFPRIHEKSLCEVLSVEAAATPAQIQAAYDAHTKAFSKDVYTPDLIGRDYAKLNEI
ncbi:MAG: hypothetical protein GY811_01465, partial [Myxococcales bacterium]|nr:hypothetical protein [Myxococcales bacterium]